MTQFPQGAPDDEKAERELLERERGFWTRGADFYRKHLDTRCMTVFADMAGVFTAADVAETVNGSGRWRDVDIELKGVHWPSPDTAMLCYEASAKRTDDTRYRAVVSSAYVKREGHWKLTFHSQIALEE